MKYLFTTLFIVLLGFAALSAPTKAHAQAGIYAFGGPIIWAYPCTCTGSYLVYVGPPRFGAVLVTPASRVFLNFMFFKPGAWVIGNALTAPAACLNPPYCQPTGFGMPVISIGTSL